MKLGPTFGSLLVVPLLFFVLFSTSRAQDRLLRRSKSGYVATEVGVRIHYLEVRPESVRTRGPAVLFVPGWMTPGWIWEHQLLHFGRHHRAIAMDPRSQGRSSKPVEGHHPAARARDIKALVDQLNLSPVLLVANGSSVTEVASYIDQFGTQTLAGLVMVNGIAGRSYDETTLQSLLSYANSFQVDRRRATDRFVRGLFKRPQSEGYLESMIEATLQMPTNSAMALILSGLSTDNRAALAKIDKPTLIVVSRVPAWMQFYDDLKNRIRSAELIVFEDAGHALFVDEPDRFNAVMSRFLLGISWKTKTESCPRSPSTPSGLTSLVASQLLVPDENVSHSTQKPNGATWAPSRTLDE